jgi:hypothetical protein
MAGIKRADEQTAPSEGCLAQLFFHVKDILYEHRFFLGK